MGGDNELLHRDITEKIIKSFFEVHTTYGGAQLFEAIYKNSMLVAMQDHGLRCGIEVPYSVYFRGHNVGDYRADLVVENCVIVEVKTGQKIVPAHHKQTLNYLKIARLKVGLIMNFGIKAEFERVFYSCAERRSDVSG